MSFTAPLWNELVFEKINELQLSQQEMFKHIANLSHRMTHLENRLTSVSSGLSLVLTHLHRESKESTIINRPNSLSAPTISSSSSSSTPTLPQTVTQNTDTNISHLVLQRSNSHPSMFNTNLNIQNSNNNHIHSNTSATTHVQSPIPVNFTNTPYIANDTNVNSASAQHVLAITAKDSQPVSDVDIKKYIDDPEEGEWTKVSRRRK
jgi:hypothetical protein